METANSSQTRPTDEAWTGMTWGDIESAIAGHYRWLGLNDTQARFGAQRVITTSPDTAARLAMALSGLRY